MIEQIGNEDGIGDEGAVTTVHVGLYGTGPVFDSTQEMWTEYIEWLDSYFIANDLTDPAKKRAILVNVIGPKTYRLIKTLLTG